MNDTSQSHACTWPNCCDQLREQVAALTAERGALRTVVQQVDALIQYQFTGRREAMDALQRVAFAAHDALGNPE